MQDEKAPRVAPLLPPAWDGEILDALGAFPSGLKFVLSRWEAGGEDARGMYTLGFLAHYPALAKAFLTFNKHAAIDSSVAVRERELLILRTGWLAKADYEFVQHVILGRRAGLTDEELERIQIGPDAPGWSADDAALIRVADDLHFNSCISDETWTRISTRFNSNQIMDMIFLVGVYVTLGSAISSFRIPLEPGVAPLDPEVKARMFGSV